MTWLERTHEGGVEPEAVRRAIDRGPDSVALVSVMWANNEVGTIQGSPIAAAAHEYGVPFHTDAVQAVGHVPVDFAASGADLLSLTAHKLGGPIGVGALVAKEPFASSRSRTAAVRSARPRSGTLDAPAITASRRRSSPRRRSTPRSRASPPCATGCSSGPGTGPRHPPGRSLAAGRPPPAAAGQRSPAHRWLRRRLAALPARRGRRLVLDRFRLPGRRPQPSHVLLAMGVSEQDARGALRLTLGHTSTEADVDAVIEALPSAIERARRAEAGDGLVRVVAAMSGGVDSAVAAARMLDAGHEVVGVHLALSQSAATLRESARGCCTIEDAGDARRVADVLGIPFYVWDMAERFKRDVVEDLPPRSTPPADAQPVPALQREDQVRRPAGQGGGARLRRRGDWSLRADRRGGPTAGGCASCTAPSTRPRTSPTSSASSTRTSWPGRSSHSVTRRSRGSARRRQSAASTSRASRTATTSASSRTATPGVARPGRSVRSRATSSTPTGRSSARHSGAYAYTVGQRSGLGLTRPAPDGQPRYVVEVRPDATRWSSGPPTSSASTPSPVTTARWCGPAPDGLIRVGAQVRATARSSRPPPGRTATGCTCASTSGSAGWRRASPSSSTRDPRRRVGDDRLIAWSARRAVDAARPTSLRSRTSVHVTVRAIGRKPSAW